MGEELELQGGRYWVVYYQPLPEAGERVAAALVFTDGPGRTVVEYDPDFAKVRKLFPNADVQTLAFYMRSMQSDLNDSADPASVLSAYGPQLAVSAARRVATPLDSAKIDLLKSRYLFPEKAKGARKRAPNPAKELEAFVRARAGRDVELRAGVSAREIFGRPVTGTKKVALAVEQESGWTLIDGVDLNQLSPQAVVDRADDIARSFWNYGRAAGEFGVRIQRVGVVLNGNSHLAEKTHEAHDYALHRFETESDTAIDAASADAGQKLSRILQDANVG